MVIRLIALSYLLIALSWIAIGWSRFCFVAGFGSALDMPDNLNPY